MKFISRLFCVFVLIAFFQAVPVQSADMSGITLHIAGGKIQSGKKVIRVKQGDEVKLNLTADQTTEIHLHGYDIEKTISPGRVVVMEFQAKVAGRFPVTVHGSHSHGRKKRKSGGHGEKVLFYLEVHP